MDIEAGEDAKEVSLKAGALKGLTYAKLHLLKMQALLDGKLKGDGPNVQMNILQQFNDKTIAIQRKISGIDIDIPTTIVEGESKT